MASATTYARGDVWSQTQVICIVFVVACAVNFTFRLISWLQGCKMRHVKMCLLTVGFVWFCYDLLFYRLMDGWMDLLIHLLIDWFIYLFISEVFLCGLFNIYKPCSVCLSYSLVSIILSRFRWLTCANGPAVPNSNQTSDQANWLGLWVHL